MPRSFSKHPLRLRASSSLLLALLVLSFQVSAEQKIRANQANLHVGETVLVCGSVAQVTIRPKVTYLNLDKAFPNHSLGLLIWQSDVPAFEKRFGKLSAMQGERVCAHGTIEEYRQHLQMKIVNPQYLRTMDP
ncbi:MAG: hypothetical protein ABI216_04110 [Devosia sp.]